MFDFYVALFVLFLSKYSTSDLQHIKILNFNGTDDFEYEKYVNISEVCKYRDFICKSDHTKVCALRYLNETFQYKSFKSTCYLFLNNLCDYFGQEFHIVETGPCNDSTSSRKFINRRTATNATISKTTDKLNIRNGSRDTGTIENLTTKDNTNKYNKTNFESETIRILKDITSKPILRTKTTTVFKPKYDIEDSFDSHFCPFSCPDIYSPVCMSVNRGEGKHFKYFTFTNHCLADMYYCINYQDLGPAPARDYEDVQVSPLGWSFCGAYRYLQFARYSEVISSMGHYGWLAGDYRYSHIMEPHQRIPGFG